MTRRPSNASCPRIVLDWIAWYPEGNLPPDVSSAVELHAAECAACREEIAELSGEGTVAASAAEGAERVFARALEKIEAQPRRASPPARRRIWVMRPRFAIAAGLAVALISGTAGVVATQRLRGEPRYAPAAIADGDVHPAAGPQLDVVFRPDASFAEVSSAMQAIGANVESGPSASGVVHLRLVQGADATVAARRLETGDLHVAEYAQPTP
jgi:Putative zinc-finger